MKIFTGQKLSEWRVWGIWIKEKYFIGVSVNEWKENIK